MSAIAAANTVPGSKASESNTPITPVSCTVSVNVPVLAPGQGYYFLIGSARSGSVSATWNPSAQRKIRLGIYAGNPFSGNPDPVTLAPPGGAIAANSGNTTSLTTTIGSAAANEYAIYFYNNGGSNVTTSSATVTYVKLTCP